MSEEKKLDVVGILRDALCQIQESNVFEEGCFKCRFSDKCEAKYGSDTGCLLEDIIDDALEKTK